MPEILMQITEAPCLKLEMERRGLDNVEFPPKVTTTKAR